MQCKFCGCTEQNACRLPFVCMREEGCAVPIVWAGDPAEAEGFMACSWLAPEICTNPTCVASAYEELKMSVGAGIQFG
jgi:hypothetical protein